MFEKNEKAARYRLRGSHKVAVVVLRIEMIILLLLSWVNMALRAMLYQVIPYYQSPIDESIITETAALSFVFVAFLVFSFRLKKERSLHLWLLLATISAALTSVYVASLFLGRVIHII